MFARTQLLAAILATTVFGPAAAVADECLTMDEQRAAIRSGDAVRPAAVRRSVDGEVLRLALCPDVGGLVYRVTVLRNGRVSTHVVNARTGALLHR